MPSAFPTAAEWRIVDSVTTLKWIPPPQSPGYLQLLFSVPLKPLSSFIARTWSRCTSLSTGEADGSMLPSVLMSSTPTRKPSPFAFLAVMPLIHTCEATTCTPFSKPRASIVAW